MEKKIKLPKQKILYEVRCFSMTNSFTEYVVAKDEDEATDKAKVIHPYMVISNISLHLSIHD